MRKIIIIFIVSIIVSCDNHKETQLIIKIDSLKIINSNLITKNDSLLKEIISLKKDANYWLDSTKNNPSKIIENIQKKPELIPLSAILGGTMNFGKIQVLSNEWIIAEFDDGHIMGRAIYEYRIENNGTINFKLIKSIQD